MFALFREISLKAVKERKSVVIKVQCRSIRLLWSNALQGVCQTVLTAFLPDLTSARKASVLKRRPSIPRLLPAKVFKQ